MPKVHEFALAPAITDETRVPSPKLNNADLPGNFNFTLLQLKNYLIAAGFQQEAVETIAANVSIADAGANFTATNVEAALAEIIALIDALPAPPAELVFVATVAALPATGTAGRFYIVADTGSGSAGGYFWNGTVYVPVGGAAAGAVTAADVSVASPLAEANVQAELVAIRAAIDAIPDPGPGGGAWVVAAITATGVAGLVRYQGAVPVLAGTSGNYTLAVASGTQLGGLSLAAASSSAATASNAFNLTINYADGTSYRRPFDLFDDGDAGKKLAPGEKGIDQFQRIVSAGSVTIELIEVGAQTSSFSIAIA